MLVALSLLTATAYAQDVPSGLLTTVAGASPAVALSLALIIGAYKLGGVAQAWADVAKEGVLIRHRVELVFSDEDRAILERLATRRPRAVA